jgi:hypothetical protein
MRRDPNNRIHGLAELALSVAHNDAARAVVAFELIDDIVTLSNKERN